MSAPSPELTRPRLARALIPLTRRPGGLPAYKLIISARRAAGAPRLRVHDGYEWFYLLSGRLRLRLGGRDNILEAGEVAEFDTHIPHCFSNPGPNPAEFAGGQSVVGQSAECPPGAG